ncbi:MAG: glycosyltransferase family 9 protein [Pseudomonadota bacterium]
MKIWISKESWKSRHADMRMAGIDFADIKNIAVIKHGALGDMVLTRPMLVTLREHFPNAKITLSVVSNYVRGIPEDLVDRVHIALGNERTYPRPDILQSYRSLGPQDILFDISATTRSFIISKLTAARLKVGYMHRGLHRFIYDVAIPRAEYRFEAETFLEQVHVLGLDFSWPLDFRPSTAPMQRKRPYLVFFPTASASDKCWPAERFAELIRHSIATRPQFEHVLLCGVAPWEQDIADQIVAAAGSHSVTLVQGGDLTNSLLAGAELLVANDTGIRNLAISLDIPTVGIFPYGSPFGYTPRFNRHRVVYHADGSIVDIAEVQQAMDQVLGNQGYAECQ